MDSQTPEITVGRYKRARRISEEHGPSQSDVRYAKRIVRSLLYKPHLLDLVIWELNMAESQMTDLPRIWLKDVLVQNLLPRGRTIRWLYGRWQKRCVKVLRKELERRQEANDLKSAQGQKVEGPV